MNTASVSKGVFVFKNGFKPPNKGGKSNNKQQTEYFCEELWYTSYKTLWSYLEKKIESLNNEMFANVLSNLINFIKTSYTHGRTVSELPAATLLTGINMPDHAAQFATLSKEIKKNISPHVAILNAQDCNNLKNLVENMINQFINEASYNDDDSDYENVEKNKIKKSQCSFALLQSWYEDFEYEHDNKVMVVIIPDFEGFNAVVLQGFIQIASNYLNILPFVLVFGVATSLSALNKALPYHVSSRINIEVFNSQPSVLYLNSVLENVFLTDECAFHLGGSLFALFVDIFLFYDFSVTGFIQNFKYAMLEHFSRGNQFALCTSPKNVKKILDQFTHEDYEKVRRCRSFRALVGAEDPLKQIKLLEDDNYFRKQLEICIKNIFAYMNKLHVFLKCLQIVVEDLPKTPLGKQFRELYIFATKNNISILPEYKEAFQLLGFQSKDELAYKIERIINVFLEEMDYCLDNSEIYRELANEITTLLVKLVDVEQVEDESMEVETDTMEFDTGILDRKSLKEQLLQRSKQQKEKSMNKYEKSRLILVTFLEKTFTENLRQPHELPFHELFFFNDISIQGNVVGSHRAAIHTALNDPTTYLQCNCCKLPNDASILDTMPDICIAYKLHLEYGKMINLYDWLQAFLSILDPILKDDDEDKREVDPRLQARFTQCVAELEYLGFVKSSKRKTDHVSRLTWGG